MAHMHPFNLLVSANGVGDPIERVAGDAINAFHPGLGQGCDEYLGDFHSQTTSETLWLLGFLCSREVLHNHRMFTARAASRAKVTSEMLDCTIIATFAQRESTGESVGEKAVLVLKARNR